MKRVSAALLTIAVTIGASAPARAECKVVGWTNGIINQPIWKCSEEE